MGKRLRWSEKRGGWKESGREIGEVEIKRVRYSEDTSITFYQIYTKGRAKNPDLARPDSS